MKKNTHAYVGFQMYTIFLFSIGVPDIEERLGLVDLDVTDRAELAGVQVADDARLTDWK